VGLVLLGVPSGRRPRGGDREVLHDAQQPTLVVDGSGAEGEEDALRPDRSSSVARVLLRAHALGDTTTRAAHEELDRATGHACRPTTARALLLPPASPEGRSFLQSGGRGGGTNPADDMRGPAEMHERAVRAPGTAYVTARLDGVIHELKVAP
jgi:hypothetical protein